MVVAIPGNCALTAQSSLIVRPVLVPHARIEGEVETVEVLVLITEVARQRDEVVGLSEQGRIHIVETRNGLSAAVRQARIDRRRDAECVEGGRRSRRKVIGDNEVVEPAAKISDFHGGARQDLLLHRHAEVPVGRPDPPSGQERGIIR
jgi:hypothetical protein